MSYMTKLLADSEANLSVTQLNVMLLGVTLLDVTLFVRNALESNA